MAVWQLEAVDLATALTREEFSVTSVGATTFIPDQETVGTGSSRTVPPKCSAAITRSVLSCFAGFYIGVVQVVAIKNLNNLSFTNALPLVHPSNPATIRSNELCEIRDDPIALVASRQARLEHKPIGLKKTTANFDVR